MKYFGLHNRRLQRYTHSHHTVCVLALIAPTALRYVVGFSSWKVHLSVPQPPPESVPSFKTKTSI